MPCRGALEGMVCGGLALAVALVAACGAGNGGSAGGGPGTGGGAVDSMDESREAVRRLPAAGTAWVIFGADTVVAELATTPDTRERGLMNRDAVPDGTGMLFIFPRSEERSFWMRDTFVPLDIAFFDEHNRIAGIRQMEARDETLIDSGIATAMALEVRQGWFEARGIAVGDFAQIVVGLGLTVR